MKHRLQRNIVILFLCSSAIPLTLVTAVGYLGARRSIENLVLRQASYSCGQIESRFDREMRRLEDRFLFMATGVSQPRLAESVVPGDPGEPLDPRVADMLVPGRYDEKFSEFVILDNGGRPRYRIDYDLGAVAVSGGPRYFLQTEHFAPEDRRGVEHLEGLEEGRVGTLFAEARQGVMALRLAAMMRRNGERIGTLLGDVDAGSLMESIVSGISLGQNAFYIVTDSRSGVVLSHPDPGRRNQLISVALPALAGVSLQDDGGEGHRFRDGERDLWLLSSRVLAGTPWVVSVAAPLGIYLAPIDRVGRLGLILLVTILAGATVMITLSTRRFRHSLAALTGAAARFSSGDLDERVAVRSQDEMGALAAAFNRMASQLQGLIRHREESARFDSFHRLSAAVTHDLKGSLSGLSLLMENMERHLEDPAFLRDSAMTIHSAVDRMKRMTRRLGQNPAQWRARAERIPLSTLIEKVLRESGISSHAAVRVETEIDREAAIRGDPEEIESLVMNLVHNAADAMPDGGTLKLVCRIRPAGGSRPASVEIAVEDTGRGMTAEFMRERLFSPFSSTKKSGLGLGLYTCREIAARHGGRVEARSEPGKGSLFTVSFPAEKGGGERA